MKIHGREVTFLHSVEADCEIYAMTEGKIEILEKKWAGDYITSQRTSAEFMAALSRASENAKKFEDPDYEKRPLTKEEAMTLDADTFGELFNEAFAAWRREKPTIETTPKKGVKKTGKK